MTEEKISASMGYVDCHYRPIPIASRRVSVAMIKEGVAYVVKNQPLLGSNLLGAVCGGVLEYLSMITGLRFLLLGKK